MLAPAPPPWGVVPTAALRERSGTRGWPINVLALACSTRRSVLSLCRMPNTNVSARISTRELQMHGEHWIIREIEIETSADAGSVAVVCESSALVRRIMGVPRDWRQFDDKTLWGLVSSSPRRHGWTPRSSAFDLPALARIRPEASDQSRDLLQRALAVRERNRELGGTFAQAIAQFEKLRRQFHDNAEQFQEAATVLAKKLLT